MKYTERMELKKGKEEARAKSPELIRDMNNKYMAFKLNQILAEKYKKEKEEAKNERLEKERSPQ